MPPGPSWIDVPNAQGSDLGPIKFDLMDIISPYLTARRVCSPLFGCLSWGVPNQLTYMASITEQGVQYNEPSSYRSNHQRNDTPAKIKINKPPPGGGGQGPPAKVPCRKSLTSVIGLTPRRPGNAHDIQSRERVVSKSAVASQTCADSMTFQTPRARIAPSNSFSMSRV